MKIVEFKRPDQSSLGFEIIKYQPNDLSRNQSLGRHRHNFHSIFWVTQGTSLQEVDFTDYHIESNQIMLIPVGAIHWEKSSEDLAGYIILFKDEFFSNAQRELLNSFLHYAIVCRKLLITVPEAEQNSLQLYTELLFHEQAESVMHSNQIFILQNLMLALLNKLDSLIHTSSAKNSFLSLQRPFQRFVSLVDHSYSQHNSLEFYAQELNMTKKKLNETIKQVTGLTATNYIIDRIILEAKRALCFSEKSIKEIANDLGYENQYYFSRIFKKRTGLNPEKFRKEQVE